MDALVSSKASHERFIDLAVITKCAFTGAVLDQKLFL